MSAVSGSRGSEMTQSSEAILANWNGELMPLSEVRVSVLDRSFLFGDAIYEVFRVYRGNLFLYQEHLDRLARNLEKMELPVGIELLSQRIQETLAASQLQEATIYLQVTRGEAPRSHTFPVPAPKPNVLIYVRPFRDPYSVQRVDGGKAITIPDVRWRRCDIKSVNLLANTMGAEQARRAGCDEAIFVDDDGTLVEGTHSSLFGVRDGKIMTSPLGPQVLPGITRRMVVQLASELQIPVIEQRLSRDSLSTLDELFLTGTSTEVLPVVEVDGQQIGNGTRGPVVSRLQVAYQGFVERKCGK